MELKGALQKSLLNRHEHIFRLGTEVNSCWVCNPLEATFRSHLYLSS